MGSLQQIDRAIINPWFIAGGFVGTLVFTSLAALLQIGNDGGAVLPWIVAALVMYVAAFIITIAINVPLNIGIKATPARMGTP